MDFLVEKWDDIASDTAIHWDGLKNSVEFCLRFTYFKFNNTYKFVTTAYEQIDGVAMGSP